MRLEIIFSNQFKRDLKLLAKRKLNLDLLEEVVEKLANQQPLEKKTRIMRSRETMLGFVNVIFNRIGS